MLRPRAAALCSIRPRFYTDNQEQVHSFDCIIGMSDVNSPATRRDRQLFRVFHNECSIIRQMNIKRPEWFGGIQLSQLFDGHTSYFSEQAVRKQS